MQDVNTTARCTLPFINCMGRKASMMARERTPVIRAPSSPCLLLALVSPIWIRLPNKRMAMRPPMMQMLITNITVPTTEASPAAFKAATDS